MRIQCHRQQGVNADSSRSIVFHKVSVKMHIVTILHLVSLVTIPNAYFNGAKKTRKVITVFKYGMC